jgi:WD40 repeat protein
LCIFQDSNHATFDNTGDVIASVTSETDKNNDKTTNFINLYNAEQLNDGPFKIFKVESVGEIRQLKFTADGEHICCVTNENTIIVTNAWDGKITNKLSGEINEQGDSLYKIDISQDSKYLMSGSEAGPIIIWNLITGEVVSSLQGHPSNSSCVKFSPRYALLASGCINLVLWTPIEF